MALRLPSSSYGWKLPRWSLLSWRRKSAFIAILACGTGILLALAVVSVWQLQNAALRQWFSLTFVPFVFIILLGAMARVQQRIDLRAGRHASEELQKNVPS